MTTYNIQANGSINLSPKRNFFGANSLLNLKLTKLPENHRGQDLYFKAIYYNTSGGSLSCPITLYSPYYFNAITPDVSDLSDDFNQEFNNLELKSLNNFEIVLLASLNPELHSNLDNFQKIPDLQVTYGGTIYTAEIEESEREERQMGQEILYDIYITRGGERVSVGKVSEYPEGSFKIYEQDPRATFSHNQVKRFLSE